jgi:hypothetical protein
MNTKTNILDRFTTTTIDGKVINTQVLKNALSVELDSCDAYGSSTIYEGKYIKGEFETDEIKDMLCFIYGGTFGGSVRVTQNTFRVHSFNS